MYDFLTKSLNLWMLGLLSYGLKVLYYVQIYSNLNHFIVSWGSMVRENDSNSLRVQQNKCIKLRSEITTPLTKIGNVRIV